MDRTCRQAGDPRKKNLVDAFHAEKHELKFSLNNLTVLPLATTSSTVAEIMTFMLVDTIWPDNSASRVNQRMQFTWVEQKVCRRYV